MGIALSLAPESQEGAILAKAGFRAARLLGLSQKEMAEVIGVSPASVSRMKDGSFALAGKPFELAACLIRVFRSLDAIVGGDGKAMKSWMKSENHALHGVPRDLVQTPAGLVDVMNYLDARRAPL